TAASSCSTGEDFTTKHTKEDKRAEIMSWNRSLLCVLCVLCGESLSGAAEPTYWADARPILRKHCVVCHAERKLADLDVSAGLALDKPENIRKGSRAGKVPVLVPGKPDESLMVTLLSSKDPK